MKYKVIFGIVIPVVVIIVITILAGSGIGFESKEKFLNEIFYKDLFEGSDLKNTINVGSIDLKNGNVLTRRHTLPARSACLVDNDGVKRIIEAGSIEYSEGDMAYAEDYYRASKDKSVEIPSNSEKTVQIYLNPNYNFRNKPYAELIEQYGDYDAIVIFEREQYSRYSYDRRYTSCSNLDADAIKESVQIPLVK